MKRFPSPNRSLAAKLVLAFFLAAVPPMLLAGSIVGGLVNASANTNVERWLRAASGYITSIIRETVEEIFAVHVLQAPRFAGQEIVFSPGELAAFRNLGVDFIILKDERGKVLFAMPASYEVEDAPLYEGSSFYRVRAGGEEKEAVAVVAGSSLTAWDGSRRELLMGSFFVIELAKNEVEPIEMRIFLPDGNGFREAFSSSEGAPFVLPEEALEAVEEGADEIFIPDPDWADNKHNAHYLLTVLRDKQNEVVAIAVISAVMLPLGDWFPTTTAALSVFFLLGTLLSGGVGYVLAARLARPIRRLNEGVRRVAGGDLGHSVLVEGHDEVAELGLSFNLMAEQLEVARRESIETTRQERARMLGEIAIGFAHEIRNPLVIIKTSAELVRNKLPEEKKETRLLGFVVEEVGRIDTLLSEFLSFAKAAPLRLEYFPLGPLVESVLEMSAAELDKRGIVWTFTDEAAADGTEAGKGQAKEKHAQIIGEDNKIRQVLLNIILNAMEAMPEGGRLDTRLFASDDGKMLFLEIRDTGKGIPEDIAATIHQPFMSGKKNSLGLGLAVAYAIVEAHGGTIFFTTRPGRGTTFTVGLKR